uniref:Uncharacterized protein n=1 Tax=Sphaerodactylus townsendi TaxID=933632 RepID=A0ACB8G6J5_9SAUR
MRCQETSSGGFGEERQLSAELAEKETRAALQKLFPAVSLPSTLSHMEWMRGFEEAVAEHRKELPRPEEVKCSQIPWILPVTHLSY